MLAALRNSFGLGLCGRRLTALTLLALDLGFGLPWQNASSSGQTN